MPTIDSTSTISPNVTLADDVVIGPHCSIEGDITIGAGTRIVGHCYMRGAVSIGANNQIFPFVTLGFEPQDRKFDMDAPCAGVAIGDDNILREGVTIHRSTSADQPTRLGNSNMLMVNTHIGHDVQVGNHCNFAPAVNVGGHAILEDQITMGGGAQFRQHIRVGRLAFIGGALGVTQHCPPFVMTRRTSLLCGVNVVGLRRANFSRPEIDHVRWAYRVMFKEGNARPVIEDKLRERATDSPAIQEMLTYLENITGPMCKAEVEKAAPPTAVVPG